MRGVLRADGSRDPTDSQVFRGGGTYIPRPTLAPQENPLPPPPTNYTVTGLNEFTQYEFQVLSENALGKVASEWTVGRTLEDCKCS